MRGGVGRVSRGAWAKEAKEAKGRGPGRPGGVAGDAGGRGPGRPGGVDRVSRGAWGKEAGEAGEAKGRGGQ